MQLCLLELQQLRVAQLLCLSPHSFKFPCAVHKKAFILVFNTEGSAGLNNAFMIASKSDLARLYNDTSVLESHHIATLYQTLARPDVDILHRLEPSKWREVRKQIINAVIHTDMTFHFPLVSKVSLLLLGSLCWAVLFAGIVRTRSLVALSLTDRGLTSITLIRKSSHGLLTRTTYQPFLPNLI